MRFNIKKISAIGASVLLAGMSMGFAAAASFPGSYSASTTAIVTGSGAAPSDATEAQSIQSALGTTSGTVSVSGEAVPLDAGTSSRIWLNTSLTTAKSIYSKTDLPTVLASGTFSGDVSSTVTQQITMGSGQASGGDNSGRVIFSKQPTSSVDPSVGLSIGTSASNPLYNATVNFGSAINFTSSDSQGQTLTLFGKDYVVSSDSSTTNGLVLFQSAKTVTLTQGGTGGTASATVTVGGASHTVTLLNAGTSSATIQVDTTSASVNVGSSRTINGVNVAVTSVQSSTAGGNTATVLVGAKKLTFQDGQQVTEGDSDQAILGTYVYLGGTGSGNAKVSALTSLTVAVFAPDTTHDWTGSGQTFVDPVFGSFGITNQGLSSSLNDSSRDSVTVGTAGSTTMTLSMTDHSGNAATFDFAHNASGNWNLSTSNGYNIYPYEMANLSLNDYTLTGTGSNNQNTGHMLQLQTVYNASSGYTNDYVQFYDPITGTTYGKSQETPVSEGHLNLNIDGRTYAVTYGGAAGSSTNAWAQIKFPSTDESGTAANSFVLYPTILAKSGESVGLYAPLAINAYHFDGSNDLSNLQIANGNGYTSVPVVYYSATNTTSVDGTNVTTAANSTVTVGQLKYVFTGTTNHSIVNAYLLQPGSTTAIIKSPAVVMFEGKDQNNHYQAVVVTSKENPAGTSSDGVGVSGVYFTSPTKYNGGSGTSGVQLYSNSNVAEYMDGFGTLVTKDSTSSSQPTATISYPESQAYEQLYLGSTSSSVSSGSTGAMLVTDSELSSVNTMNLIVVGGSCINSAAATLVGGAYCGDAWTTATGIGSGQALIKSYAAGNTNGLTSGTALLVAGYNAADTVMGATYLTEQKPDIAAGKAWKVTSTVSATSMVTSA